MDMRLLLVLSIIFVAATSLRAQSIEHRLFAEVAGGMTSAGFDFGMGNPTPERDAGLSVRALLGYQLTRAADVRVGLSYSRFIAHLTQHSGSSTQDPIEIGGESAFSADYNLTRLSAPVLLRLAVPVGAFRIGATGGLSINTVLSATDKETYRWSGWDHDSTMNGSESLTSPYLSLVGGGSIGYAMSGRVMLSLDALWERTLGNIHEHVSQLEHIDNTSPYTFRPFGYDQLWISSIAISAGVKVSL